MSVRPPIGPPADAGHRTREATERSYPEAIEPLFLLSLPRSGSTLVQRVLGRHPEIATASETWLLMPFLATAGDGPSAPRGAWDVMTGAAVSDFSRALDGGMEAYREAGRDFVLRLYGNVAPEGATHFLDKSPPYALFMPELARIFPEARFIALWRNPLAVVASVVETFCEGRWEPDRYSVSLFASLEALVEAT